MPLTQHATAPVMNVKGPFEGLTHQTLAGAALGDHDAALWQHHMIEPLSVPPHYHECEETVVALSGTLRFQVGMDASEWRDGVNPLENAVTTDVGPEATFVVPARAIHAYDIVGVPARVLIFLPDAHAQTRLSKATRSRSRGNHERKRTNSLTKPLPTPERKYNRAEGHYALLRFQRQV